METKGDIQHTRDNIVDDSYKMNLLEIFLTESVGGSMYGIKMNSWSRRRSH